MLDKLEDTLIKCFCISMLMVIPCMFIGITVLIFMMAVALPKLPHKDHRNKEMYIEKIDISIETPAINTATRESKI